MLTNGALFFQLTITFDLCYVFFLKLPSTFSFRFTSFMCSLLFLQIWKFWFVFRFVSSVLDDAHIVDERE